MRMILKKLLDNRKNCDIMKPRKDRFLKENQETIQSDLTEVSTMELKGSKTEKNLWEAFAGESQARNKYTYFASKAKKEGY